MARFPHHPKAANDTYKPALGFQNRSGRPPNKQTPKEAQKEYPWDSHQDDVVVNTTELDTPGRKLGIEHYCHQLTLRKTYEHITTDFAEDQRRVLPKDALPVSFSCSSSGKEHEEGDENDDDDDDNTKTKSAYRHHWDKSTNSYTTLAKPNFTRLTYSESIYRATTTNPAVFLATIRIAERNLPFINFDSAITHLPNRAPNAFLPPLPRSFNKHPDQSGKGRGKASFTEDTPWEENKGDEAMTLLFLPQFYQDGRHAVGYYALSPAYDRDGEKKLGVEDVVQVLFTPCETGDLQRWGLVQWIHGAAHLDEARRLDDAAIEEEGGGGKDSEYEDPDTEYMEFVGARGGKWLERGTVEDYGEWVEGFRVVRRIWEKIIKAVVSGGEEDEP